MLAFERFQEILLNLRKPTSNQVDNRPYKSYSTPLIIKSPRTGPKRPALISTKNLTPSGKALNNINRLSLVALGVRRKLCSALLREIGSEVCCNTKIALSTAA
jgi:hypothetical protein